MQLNIEVSKTVDILSSGGTIIYPTDTIWGIGCDAFNPDAVDTIFKLKKRATTKKMILLVSSHEMLERYVNRISPKASALIEFFHRPLTIIYDRVKDIPDYLISEDGTIAIRIPKDKFCKAIISQLNRPIVASSANISGDPFPTNFKSIHPQLLEEVDYVVRHKQEEESLLVPSSIVKIPEKGELIFLRN